MKILLPTRVPIAVGLSLTIGLLSSDAVPPEKNPPVSAVSVQTNPPLSKAGAKPRKRNDKPLVFSFEKSGEKAVVPFLRAGPDILVPACVNGQAAGYFLVDTGAYCNVLDATVATQSGLVETGEWHIAGFGGSDKAKVCKVDSLSLGDLELQNHSLTLYDLNRVSEGVGVKLAGILGAILWGRLPFTLDYRASTLTFYPAETFEAPPRGRMEQLKVINGHPAVKCRLDDQFDGWFLLDTGAQGHVSVDEPYLKEHPDLLAGKKRRMTMVSGIVGTEPCLDVRLAAFEVFGDKRSDVPATFQPVTDPKQPNPSHLPLNEAVVGLIGESILRHYRLTFDYINHQIWSEKVPDESADDLRKRLPDLNIKDLAGYTPLMLAILHEDDRIVETLLGLGADLEAQTGRGETPLLCAIQVKRADFVNRLLSKGARLEAKPGKAATPVDLAILSGNLEIIQALLAKGSRLSGADARGWTPLFKAVLSGEAEVVRFLLDKGLAVDTQDAEGITPLMLAVLQGHEEIVKLLLEKGAPVNVKNKDGISVVELANRQGNPKIVEMLQKAGAGK